MWCCGENPTLDETKDLKCAFAHENLKANGDIFEEYYYDLEAMNVFKVQPSDKTYTIGDVIRSRVRRISIRTALMWLFCVSR